MAFSDSDLLALCLKISGSFEARGAPSYTDLAGNADGQGCSAGLLQWNAGQGTLQRLVSEIGTAMGWPKAQTFFHSDIHQFSLLPPKDAVQWCIDHYLINNTTELSPLAKQAWQAFLSQPESVQAQIDLATRTVLARAKILAARYCPNYISRNRPIVFFFDLITQQGGMQVGHTIIPVASEEIDMAPATAFATIRNPKCATIWNSILPNDPLAQLLLYYAYERSLLGLPQYQWDTFARRGSIGARKGIVHEAIVDFTGILD